MSLLKAVVLAGVASVAVAQDTLPLCTAFTAISGASEWQGYGGVEVHSNGVYGFVKRANIEAGGVMGGCALKFGMWLSVDAAGQFLINYNEMASSITYWKNQVNLNGAKIATFREIPRYSCAAYGCKSNKWNTKADGSSSCLTSFALDAGEKCFCDDACTQFGDCCGDYQFTCGVYKKDVEPSVAPGR